MHTKLLWYHLHRAPESIDPPNPAGCAMADKIKMEPSLTDPFVLQLALHHSLQVQSKLQNIFMVSMGRNFATCARARPLISHCPSSLFPGTFGCKFDREMVYFSSKKEGT